MNNKMNKIILLSSIVFKNVKIIRSYYVDIIIRKENFIEASVLLNLLYLYFDTNYKRTLYQVFRYFFLCIMPCLQVRMISAVGLAF